MLYRECFICRYILLEVFELTCSNAMFKYACTYVRTYVCLYVCMYVCVCMYFVYMYGDTV